MPLISPVNMIQLPPGRKPSYGTPLNLSHPLAAKLGGAWLCNENAGNCIYTPVVNLDCTYYGTFVNNTAWQTTEYGSALYFPDGTNDCVKVAAVNTVPPNMTFVTRFKCTGGAGTNRSPIGLYAPAPTTKNIFVIYVASANNLNAIAWNGATEVYAGSVAYSQDVWYHAALVADGTRLKFYINGVLEKNVACAALGTAASELAIGCRDYTATAFDFVGLVEHAYVFPAALSQNEITSLYLDTYAMFRPSMPYWFWSSLGGASYEITPAGLSQTQTIGYPVIYAEMDLTPAGLTQKDSIGNLDFNYNVDLTPANLGQASTISQAVVYMIYEIVAAGLAQASTLSESVLTKLYALTMADLSQAETLGNEAITMEMDLTPANLSQAETLGNAGLTSLMNLVVANLSQAETLQEVTVGIATNTLISIDNLLQDQTLSEEIYEIIFNLDIDNLTQGQRLALCMVYEFMTRKGLYIEIGVDSQ